MNRRVMIALLTAFALILTGCRAEQVQSTAGEALSSLSAEETAGSTAAPATIPVVDPMAGTETSAPQTTDEPQTTEEPETTEELQTTEEWSEPEATAADPSETEEIPEGTSDTGSDATTPTTTTRPRVIPEETETQNTRDPEESGAEDPEGTSPGGETEVPGPQSVTEDIYLDQDWRFAEESVIHSGHAVLYRAQNNWKGIVVGVNAGHGTEGGSSVKAYCHPDHTPKVTGGTTAEGSLKAIAVSSGMDFDDGTPESRITLKVAQYLRDLLLAQGYDVLMLRDGKDVQLDNIARTVICNNMADCHIAIHYDSDGMDYNKGAYFMSVPDALKDMYPVSEHWREHEELGRALIAGCKETGFKVWSDGSMDMDLTQTSYSTVPSVDIEMGNQSSAHDDDACYEAAEALLTGIGIYFEE